MNQAVEVFGFTQPNQAGSPPALPDDAHFANSAQNQGVVHGIISVCAILALDSFPSLRCDLERKSALVATQ